MGWIGTGKKKKWKKSAPSEGTRAVTVAPGKRYYGPEELRPSTKYKRGGELEKFKKKGYTDLDVARFEKAKAMKAAGPQPQVVREMGRVKDPETGEMIQQPGAGAAAEEATKPKEPGIFSRMWEDIQPGAEPRPGTPGARMAEEAAALGMTPAQVQHAKIAEAFGGVIPANAIETIGVLAAAPLMGAMAAGKGLTHQGFFGGPRVLTHITTKQLGLLGKIWATTVGKIALVTGGASVILGGIYTANMGLGAALMGMWSGTESPEGAQFPLKQLFEVTSRMPSGPEKDAAWKKFDDYMATSTALAEAADPSKFKNQIQPWKQFERKWKNTRIGISALTDAAAINRGLKTWEEIKQEEREEEMMLLAERRAATAKDKAFWAKLQKEKHEHWNEYWEQAEKIEQDNTKSNLKFGLL